MPAMNYFDSNRTNTAIFNHSWTVYTQHLVANYAGIVQSNLCWKIHNKYVFHVNIHIFVLKYLVQIQIIQNQFKISEGGKWNSHQMLCVYSSWMVKNYRICPIRIEIIHGRHRVVQIKNLLFWNCLAKWTETWWEGSVLSFLKAEWKVSDTGSVHWASSLNKRNNQPEARIACGSHVC
jgi:hypothetical protein